ncbi:MAG: Fe-S cluster assembly protein HesB [Candidatus Marinimicrobia bacterium]|nr:Fe-S cluster assembly protein HesB [Candidatus Neomarinimicrobiota bacterium]|tara:strand:+ start:2765 stop:3373 length:609 start_codon:yes stop_codon:yes gene_type:complete
MNFDSAIEFLKKDSKMNQLIRIYDPPILKPQDDYFYSLVRSIVFQQLNGKVAKIIFMRFIKLLPVNKINSRNVLMLDNNEMKKAGLSFQKINYIKNLAHFFNENLFDKKSIEKMSDEEIIELLIKIKGVGQWTIDMFLMFTLNRLDVMPYSDLAIKKGMKSLFSLNELPRKNEMKRLSINWSPYRTIACMYLWKSVDDSFEW